MWRPIPPLPRAGNSAPRQRAGWVGAKSWEGHGHDTLLTDSSSSAERVLGSEGVTVLVYLVVGIYRGCYPCCRTVLFVTVAVLDPVTACAQGVQKPGLRPAEEQERGRGNHSTLGVFRTSPDVTSPVTRK